MSGREREPRRELLAWAAGLGAVNAEGLALRYEVSRASARGRLAAAARAGTLRAWRPAADVPTLYTVTTLGLREAGVEGLAPSRVSAAGARHAAASCLAAAALARAFPGSEVHGEQAVRRAERGIGRPFASLRAGRAGPAAGERQGHRPDLLLLGGHGALPVAVEVELSVKATARLAAICRAWGRSRSVAGVIYLAGEATVEPLRRAIAATGSGGRVVVVELDALIAAAGAPPC